MTAAETDHSNYCELSFPNRFIKHRDLCFLIDQLKKTTGFSIRLAGRSVLGKEIFRIQAGKGATKVLLWSQMHGDEATGTMAIFDLLNFLKADDEYRGLRNRLLNTCTFTFVPMLNPDGAEKHQRRNAQGIDINRDFLALQSPEASLLLELQEEIQPDFAFNLHDQDTLWSVGGTKKPATISLLAPPVDALNTLTEGRVKAMQIIGVIDKMLQERIPGQVGRWNDDYEPRAVGETFQSRGVSTILVEAGGFHNDPEKQFIRTLYFKTLLCGLEQISTKSYTGEDLQAYNNIPMNTKEIFHLLFRNCRLEVAGKVLTADIGCNYREELSGPEWSPKKIFTIADFGDLSTSGAYEVYEAGEVVINGPVMVDAKPDFCIRTRDGKGYSFCGGMLSIV